MDQPLFGQKDPQTSAVVYVIGKNFNLIEFCLTRTKIMIKNNDK